VLGKRIIVLCRRLQTLTIGTCRCRVIVEWRIGSNYKYNTYILRGINTRHIAGRWWGEGRHFALPINEDFCLSAGGQ
jgi:hypothetical protein